MSTPFQIDVTDEVLTDLRERLRRTRLPVDFANDDWRYGPPAAYLAELVEYWIDGYDWRAQERAMNSFSHFRTSIDDIPIHYLLQKGTGPDPIPIVLTHGWPWTFWDYRDVIGPLADPGSHGGDPADAFDVIVPSLPGFAFSSPLERTGVTARSTADLWATLMTERLGYSRFAAAGGDWGNVVTAQLGHKHADKLIGINLFGSADSLDIHGGAERPWDPFGAVPPEVTGEDRTRALATQRKFASHNAVQVLDPQTLSYAMHDSPAGMLAWLLQRRHEWSDCHGEVETTFSRDDLLTSVMLYWVTESFVTSVRFYHETAHVGFVASHDRSPRIEAPTGLSLFQHETGPLARRRRPLDWDCNLVAVHEHTTGGHFAPSEAPGAVIDDLRATFRNLRTG